MRTSTSPLRSMSIRASDTTVPRQVSIRSWISRRVQIRLASSVTNARMSPFACSTSRAACARAGSASTCSCSCCSIAGRTVPLSYLRTLDAILGRCPDGSVEAAKCRRNRSPVDALAFQSYSRPLTAGIGSLVRNAAAEAPPAAAIRRLWRHRRCGRGDAGPTKGRPARSTGCLRPPLRPSTEAARAPASAPPSRQSDGTDPPPRAYVAAGELGAFDLRAVDHHPRRNRLETTGFRARVTPPLDLDTSSALARGLRTFPAALAP